MSRARPPVQADEPDVPPPTPTEPTPPPFDVTPPQPGVGTAITRSTVDTAIAQLSRTIETWAHQVEAFHEWIDTMPDADLEKPPFNYEPIAVAVLKSATHDLWDLSEVYHGNLAVDTPRDFGIFSRRTAGLNLPGLLGLPPL